MKKTVVKTITAGMTTAVTATNSLLSSGSVEAREAELTPLTQVTALAPAVPSAVMALVATGVQAHKKSAPSGALGWCEEELKSSGPVMA